MRDLHSANSLKSRPWVAVHSLRSLTASGDTTSIQTIAFSIGTLGAAFNKVGIWSEVAKTIERWAWSMLNKKYESSTELKSTKVLHVFWKKKSAGRQLYAASTHRRNPFPKCHIS